MKLLTPVFTSIAICVLTSGNAASEPISLFEPHVHVGEQLSYQSVEYAGEPVNMLHRESISIKISKVDQGRIEFTYDWQGHAGKDYERAQDGSLRWLNGDKWDSPPLVFFWPKQQYGTPPDNVKVGTSWTVDMTEPSFFGGIGIAKLTVTRMNAGSRTLGLQLLMRSIDNATGTPPGVNAPVQFKIYSTREANITLKNGIIQSITVSGQDVQKSSGGFTGSVTMPIHDTFTLVHDKP